MNIKVNIIKIIDKSFPIFVECEFFDIYGTKHTIKEKLPIITTQETALSGDFPMRGFLRCVALKEGFENGEKIVRVSTKFPDDVETTEGIFIFDLSENQIIY